MSKTYEEEQSIYVRKGFPNRGEYLRAVAEQYSAGIQAVAAIASLLGPEEDFDGLLSEVADMTGNPFMSVGE